jgi:predicted PurR-regulated permease PerM
MPNNSVTNSANFIAALTVALIAASLWIFSSFLHYILVAAVLSLATSHGFNALLRWIDNSRLPKLIKNKRRVLAAFLLTSFFLMMIFLPLLYLIIQTSDLISTLNIELIKQTILAMWNNVLNYADSIPLLNEPLARLKAEGSSLIDTSSIRTLLKGGENIVSGTSGLVIQIGWILMFYFLFNIYGDKILYFLGTLTPTNPEHEQYLYRECTGTVAVVFYGTLFNMTAQGLSFGLLMTLMGGYNATYLGVLAGFCSIVPIIGAAPVYIPVIAIELFAGHFLRAGIILTFAWVVMAFFFDNILRLLFIGYLKKVFGFEYTMNGIFILLSILAGISTFGFWGLILGPSVLALTLAAANLYRHSLIKDSSEQLPEKLKPETID